MNLEDLKTSIRNLTAEEQRQLMIDILPELLPQGCTDEACLDIIRNFLNNETSKSYREQHMGGI